MSKITQKSQIKIQISTIRIRNFENRLGSHLKGKSEIFEEKNFQDISPTKFGSANAQSPRKCSNFKILAKIEGKEAKFFSKLYQGHIRI